MATFGEKVRLVRTFRGLTQKALGIAVGLNEKTADIRIAQYESGSRYPKQTGSKLGKEYVKAVYCHHAYLNYMHD